MVSDVERFHCSLKYFAIFTRKHLCWGLFLVKLQAFKPAKFLKREFKKGVSCVYCEIFKSSFFIEHLRWLLLTVLPQYSKGSWGVCSLVLRVHVLSVLIKTYTKRWTNTSLVSRDETISFLLEWINHVLPISGCVLGKH